MLLPWPVRLPALSYTSWDMKALFHVLRSVDSCAAIQGPLGQPCLSPSSVVGQGFLLEPCEPSWCLRGAEKAFPPPAPTSPHVQTEGHGVQGEEQGCGPQAAPGLESSFPGSHAGKWQPRDGSKPRP